mmetsp:Transcript_4849/g.10980  ORF Transcript_4849/g.10980 Transcript_4849/m.10980 type:complete len:215 (+) Transcript_4849:200-844(+)
MPPTPETASMGVDLAWPDGRTNQTRATKSMMFPIQAPSCPKWPAGVRDPSRSYMCSLSMNRPTSRNMCLVGSNIASKAPRRRTKNGPQRFPRGKFPRLPGVLAATKVSMLAKDARLRPQLNVCASLREPTQSTRWKAGPRAPESTAGQHQAAIRDGSESRVTQPAPAVDVSTSLDRNLLQPLPSPAGPSRAAKSGSVCQLPSGQSFMLLLGIPR